MSGLGIVTGRARPRGGLKLGRRNVFRPARRRTGRCLAAPVVRILLRDWRGRSGAMATNSPQANYATCLFCTEKTRPKISGRAMEFTLGAA
jgi:hypothetical protein